MKKGLSVVWQGITFPHIFLALLDKKVFACYPRNVMNPVWKNKGLKRYYEIYSNLIPMLLISM